MRIIVSFAYNFHTQLISITIIKYVTRSHKDLTSHNEIHYVTFFMIQSNHTYDVSMYLKFWIL